VKASTLNPRVAYRSAVGVVAVGPVGTLLARFRPAGMARMLVALAIAQALVAAIALLAGLGWPYSPPMELGALNGVFVALFVASALLFGAAGRTPRRRRPDPLG
jgi:hypothetical protein